MLKKILRKGFKVILWISFVRIFIAYCFGYRSVNATILLVLLLLICFTDLIAPRIVYGVKKIKYDKLFDSYIGVFEKVKHAHGLRYWSYFNSTKESVEKYSKILDDGMKIIYEYSKILSDDECASEMQKKQIECIVAETKRLEQRVQPPL